MDAVNDAQLSLLDDTSLWDFLETEGTFSTVAGTDTYTYTVIGSTTLVPTTGVPGEILGIENDTVGGPLVPLSWEALERAALSTQDPNQARGQPGYFAKWGAGAGAKIRLYPNPDAVYTLRWFGRSGIPTMTTGTDVPVLPLAWRHRILTPYAAAHLLRIESGYAAAYEASGLEAQSQQAVAALKIARGSAKRPAMGVQSPGFGRHLPPIDAGGF
jgi:hypothetical protein